MARLQLLLAACLLALATPIKAEVTNHTLFHNLVITHAVFAASAWALFFPLGAIVVRVITHQARAIHAWIQVFAMIVFTIGWVLGVIIATESGQWVTFNGHAIIGTIVFGLAITQPITGLLHRHYWKNGKKLYRWAWMHVWLGRILITAGIINGGLGLQLSGESNTDYIIYGVLAGFVWLVYISISIIAIIRSHGDIDVRGESGEKVQGLKHPRPQDSDSTLNGDAVSRREKQSMGDHDATGTVNANAGVQEDTFDPPPANKETSVHIPPGGNDIVHGGAHYNTRMANILDPEVPLGTAQ